MTRGSPHGGSPDQQVISTRRAQHVAQRGLDGLGATAIHYDIDPRWVLSDHNAMLRATTEPLKDAPPQH
jgi:hypothetical protein